MSTAQNNGAERKTATTGEGPLSYLDAGPATRPLVVLVHGWPATAMTWTPQITALVAAGHRVIAPDMRGYGEDRIMVRWNKTRWRCREDYCGRGSFTESIAQVPAWARTTRRLRTQISAAVGDAARSVAEVAAAHCGVVADRAPGLRRPRREGAGRAAAHLGARHRRDPPWKAPLGTVRGNRAVGAGRPVGHRIRRPGRRSGPARATRRPHRRGRGHVAGRAQRAVPRGHRTRGHRPGRRVRLGDPHTGTVAQRHACGRPLSPGRPRQRRTDQGPPPRHLGPARPPRPAHRPGMGQPPPPPPSTRTPVRQEFRGDVERHRRRGRHQPDPVGVDRQ